jgi:hypothetical protein
VADFGPRTWSTKACQARQQKPQLAQLSEKPINFNRTAPLTGSWQPEMTAA